MSSFIVATTIKRPTLCAELSTVNATTAQ